MCAAIDHAVRQMLLYAAAGSRQQTLTGAALGLLGARGGDYSVAAAGVGSLGSFYRGQRHSTPHPAGEEVVSRKEMFHVPHQSYSDIVVFSVS